MHGHHPEIIVGLITIKESKIEYNICVIITGGLSILAGPALYRWAMALGERV
jgi:hypothetical protein